MMLSAPAAAGRGTFEPMTDSTTRSRTAGDWLTGRIVPAARRVIVPAARRVIVPVARRAFTPLVRAVSPYGGLLPPSRPARVARLASAPALPELNPHISPWPAERVEVCGMALNVRRTPSSSPAARPALYVHGLGGASTNFTDLADVLSPWLDGHAVDLPGFGDSGPPPGSDYSIADHARVVEGYLQLLARDAGGPAHLVGNSMGGAIAIEVAASRPDLVRTLTLVSPAVPDLRPPKGSAALMPVLLIPGLGEWLLSGVGRGTPDEQARSVVELCFAHPERVPEHRLAEAAAEIEARRGQPWADDALVRSLRGLVRGYFARGPRSPWQRMRQITAPTTVVWGELDRLVDVANAPRVAQAIPDATLLVLPDVGHTAQLEDPLSTARAILALLERANDGFDGSRVEV